MGQTLVSIHELRNHAPELKDGSVVACQGCQWRLSYIVPRTTWEQYISHLPAFRVDGYLPWTDEDLRMLAQMTMACEGPAKKFEE